MTIIHLDRAIIEGIRGGSQKFENILFERFRGIENIGEIGKENSEDKFQIYIDTITDVIFQIRRDENLQINNLKAYIKTILKYKYFKFLKQKIKARETLIHLEDMPFFEVPDSLLGESAELEIQNIVNQMMEKIDEKCREIFKAKYYNGLRFQEIALKMDIASAGAARVANHGCLEKMRKVNKKLIEKIYG